MYLLPTWRSLSLAEKKALNEAWTVGDFCAYAHGEAVPRLIDRDLIYLNRSGHYQLSEKGLDFMRSIV